MKNKNLIVGAAVCGSLSFGLIGAVFYALCATIFLKVSGK